MSLSNNQPMHLSAYQLTSQSQAQEGASFVGCMANSDTFICGFGSMKLRKVEAFGAINLIKPETFGATNISLAFWMLVNVGKSAAINAITPCLRVGVSNGRQVSQTPHLGPVVGLGGYHSPTRWLCLPHGQR